jgi:hypothetical protein
MQQEDDFIFWLDEFRNYGLTVTKARLIKSLNEFNHNSYQFAMSPDAKTMVVLIESDKECEDDDV